MFATKEPATTSYASANTPHHGGDTRCGPGRSVPEGQHRHCLGFGVTCFMLLLAGLMARYPMATACCGVNGQTWRTSTMLR